MPEADVDATDAGTVTTTVIPAGEPAGKILAERELQSRSGPETVVVVRDPGGALRDLSWAPEADTEVELVRADTEDGRSVIRHSCAHVLAQAVQDKFPEAKLGIGPPIENGFYYDFDVAEPFTPEDLKDLEKRMKKIIKSGQRFARREYASLDEARAELAGEPYKLELVEDKGRADAGDADGAVALEDSEIMEVGAGALTAYDNLNPRTGEVIWSDLCRGPHTPTTKFIPAFTLTRSSAAYWRGDQNNAGLQRIYGTAWESTEAMDAYLDRLAEAEKRDHRRLGTELDLFSFPDEIGSGFPVFHPRGGIIRNEMEQHSLRRHLSAGYSLVNTPHVTKGDLFRKSQHLSWYSEGMFPPMVLDAE
ncbi:MAG: threonine--tRNA ligase, partial [Dietzia cercidiphylli]